MKEDISEDYPTGLTNEELLTLIKEYSKSATIAGRSSQYVTGPSYWKEMVELGQLEISNRVQNNLFLQIEKLTTEIKLLKEDNKKSGKITTTLSILTIILAVLTGYIGYLTLDYSKSAGASDSTWKSNEIELLKQNNVELQNIRTEINKINFPTKDDNLHKTK